MRLRTSNFRRRCSASRSRTRRGFRSTGVGDGLGQLESIGDGTPDYAYAMALQKDGKVVLAGTSNGNFALARYTPNGGLDASFDGDGKAITDTGGTDMAGALDFCWSDQ